MHTHHILLLDDKDFLFFQNVLRKPQNQRNRTRRPDVTQCITSHSQLCSGSQSLLLRQHCVALALRSFLPSSKSTPLPYFSMFISGKEERKVTQEEKTQIILTELPAFNFSSPCVAFSPVFAAGGFELLAARKLKFLKE